MERLQQYGRRLLHDLCDAFNPKGYDAAVDKESPASPWGAWRILTKIELCK